MFGSDGELLPETFTRVSTIATSNEKAAQLLAVHMQVDSTLGLPEIRICYLKHLSFLHVKDSYGDGEVSHAMALLPTEDQLGVSLDSLKESIMFQSGIYQNVELPSTCMTIRRRALWGGQEIDFFCKIPGQAHFAAKADSIQCLR